MIDKQELLDRIDAIKKSIQELKKTQLHIQKILDTYFPLFDENNPNPNHN